LILFQLDSALNGLTDGIKQKEILSMTTEELYQAQDDVDNLIDELQAAIKKYKGQLSKLGPQLQAEEEQHATYVYQHIKELPANSALPQGLQLKVFENGQDAGEVLVYINRKEVGKGCYNDTGLMMERLLQIVHQRLQCTPGYNPSGLNLTPSRLFNEQGHEIKNPLLLQNEQKVWVSYGEDYRSPQNQVLSLSFDRVIAAKEDGCIAVYKTLLDPNIDLPSGYDRWNAVSGFPDNYHYKNQDCYHKQEKLDSDNHFLQLKEDPQIILHASMTMENRSRRPLHAKKDHQDQMNAAASTTTTWPLSHVWLVIKTGMILSRAMPQFCLAVGNHPIRLKSEDGASLETYKLTLQKSRGKGDSFQQWGFDTEGHIYSKAYPEFVLTYLEELNVKEDVTQTEHRSHQGAWSTADQETDSSSAEEFQQNSLSSGNQNQLLEPQGAQSMPAGPLGESTQLTVALVRKLEEKHPKASAQR
uniref:Doublecortin domain-containing protein n=1 Tax=Latimeria chalumnae TaxID=7897 RepID=H3AWR1_LATCH